MVPPPTRGWPPEGAWCASAIVGAPAHAGMAPDRSGRRSAFARCPRPRGDGPDSGLPMDPTTWVPPPTRGWPRFRAAHGSHNLGAPAHAGMAPARCAAARAWQRCPRPRGDGPKMVNRQCPRFMVPPPTRGWPCATCDNLPHDYGAPAHAGMAPGRARSCSAPGRCPRPRGDGPLTKPGVVMLSRVPPPTRGWPLIVDDAAAVQPGAPAHAGMAPARYATAEALQRCPRPRGDGPGPCRAGPTDSQVPPPTRGWPPGGPHGQALQAGAPAHAGMAPTLTAAAQRWMGCPRPRGDGPDLVDKMGEDSEVPPPTRGWPPCYLQACMWCAGAPAHAGMAPGSDADKLARLRCPRPRGDGPSLCSRPSSRHAVPPPTRGWPRIDGQVRSRADGAPAHAGMAPTISARQVARYGCPRPRGDGPVTAGAGAPSIMVPPPTRGWPPEIVGRRMGRDGAPAHAGMAPSFARLSRSRSWCPRPRGDGPDDPEAQAIYERVPPPTRGWPFSLLKLKLSRRGAPAHAGMALSPSCSTAGAEGCPRPRGDGPETFGSSKLVDVVPPPTRGWPL